MGAFAGETLVPRDVRVLRRTVKDLLTTVPFIIILLIPLSPVGHVFVFGAIQRFFPDFFPSCYTEHPAEFGEAVRRGRVGPAAGAAEAGRGHDLQALALG